MIAPQQLGSFEELVLEEQWKQRPRRVRCCDYTQLGGNPIEYHAAWNLQKQLLQSHLDRLARNDDDNDGDEDDESFIKRRNGVDTILLLEHAPVYTLGTGSDANFIHASTHQVPVVRMDRGGEVTYHGPGQLTVYPILDLRNGRYRADIHWYIRALEEVVLRAVAKLARDRSVPSLSAHRVPDVTGVWIEDCKVAAVGVKCRKWITQHGFAINVTPESMQYMDGIVPCGLVGRKVGYINQFLTSQEQSPITVAEMASYVRAALEEVFQIQLRVRSPRENPDW
jgi:lipoyl(octanoyl) transferase